MFTRSSNHISIHSKLVCFKQFNCDFVHAANGTVVKLDWLGQYVLDTFAKKLFLILSRLVVDLYEKFYEHFSGNRWISPGKRHKRH